MAKSPVPVLADHEPHIRALGPRVVQDDEGVYQPTGADILREGKTEPTTVGLFGPVVGDPVKGEGWAIPYPEREGLVLRPRRPIPTGGTPGSH